MPIGEISPCMRRQRAEWMAAKDTHNDEICRQFCSDIYVDYNNKCEEFTQTKRIGLFTDQSLIQLSNFYTETC
jgi:hypothetical protein